MLLKYFRELADFNGSASAGRFGFLYSVLVSNTVVWYTWLIICILKKDLVNIPEGVYTALAVANGAAFIGKGMQSFAERPQINMQTSTEVRTKTTVAEKEPERPKDF
jgi:hypothetical protein